MGIAVRPQPDDDQQDYYSAELKMGGMNVLYQLKLRKNDPESTYALVKQESPLLDYIKAGDIVPMTYYHSDRSVPCEDRDTRIKYIKKDSLGRFKGNCLIGLEMDRNF